MAVAANSFLQGVMGGAGFVDSMYSRKAERDWLGEQRQHQTSEWQREKDVRKATAAYQEEVDRMNEFNTLYKHSLTLPKDKQKEFYDYTLAGIFNELEPDLVNMGAKPGEHKELLPPQFVKGGMIPQVAVIDDKTGKTLRTDNLTLDRGTGGTPLVADGGAIPEYYIASEKGREALRRARIKMIELGGKPPDPKETWGKKYYDKYGNTLQDSSTGQTKLVVSAQKSGRSGSGSGSGGGGSKNMQFFYTSDPFALQTGVDDNGDPVMTEAITQNWYDPNDGKFYQGQFINGQLRGQAQDITDRMQGQGGVSAGLATNIKTGRGTKPDEEPKPTPENGVNAAAAKPQPVVPEKTWTQRWKEFVGSSSKEERQAGFSATGHKVADYLAKVDTPAAAKKAQRLAQQGKWEEVEKLVSPKMLERLKKAYQK